MDKKKELKRKEKNEKFKKGGRKREVAKAEVAMKRNSISYKRKKRQNSHQERDREIETEKHSSDCRERIDVPFSYIHPSELMNLLTHPCIYIKL